MESGGFGKKDLAAVSGHTEKVFLCWDPFYNVLRHLD